MSTDPKPAELTEAEIRSLEEPLANWAVSQVWLDDTDPLCIEVARIVAAREAAARREALLEAAEKHLAEVGAARRDGEMRSAALWYAERAKVERVEALATGLQEQYEASDYSETASLGEIVKAIRAALAEPERDEESGMLGGSPNFKHRDATVPMDGEQPGPRAKPRLRACVEAWPGCAEGEYNPACCRFPKSCSCDVYDPARVGPEDLEEGSR